MNIFLSHAIADQDLIKTIQKTLEPYKIKFLIAEHTRDHELNITEKIEALIRKSDIGLVLLTESGYNSHFVQQEIGYIKSLKKPFIQVIQKGFESKIKGFNFGKDYILLDLNNSNVALNQLREDLLKFFNKISKKKEAERKILEVKKYQEFKYAEQRRRKIHEEKQQANAAFAVLAGLLILGIASGK